MILGYECIVFGHYSIIIIIIVNTTHEIKIEANNNPVNYKLFSYIHVANNKFKVTVQKYFCIAEMAVDMIIT